MNEHGFIRAVNQRLTCSHKWKICDNFAGGVPDSFYEGEKRDLWVEYKFIKLPKRPTTIIDLTKQLSDHQQIWLERRHKKRQDAWVIVGSPEGHVIFKELEWQKPITAAEFRSKTTSYTYIIKEILAFID